MQTLKLLLSLSTQGYIEARVIDSPTGQAMEPGPYSQVDADRFIKLHKHKRTFLKVLEGQSSPDSVFAKNPQAQDWLVSVGLLNQDRNQFVPDLYKKAGQILFDALFLANDHARQRLHDSRVKVPQKDTLHIQFVISAEDDASASLLEYPWELLYGKVDKYDKKDEFLAWKNITFSRYIAYGDSPPEWSFTDKLEVLLVSLDAYDEKLGLKKISQVEIDKIKESLQKAVDIHLAKLESPSFQDFGRYLSKCERLPHIIHFHGHGLFGKKCQACGSFSTDLKENRCGNENCKAVDSFNEPQGHILFKGEGTPSNFVSAEDLAIELGNANSNESSSIELVVLSTCQSGLALDNYTIFDGIAQRLIRSGIPAVVAMQFSVDIQAAADFAERFYTLLGKHAAIAEAMKNGRVAMRSSGKDNQWYRPVLYTRWAGDGKGDFFTAGPTSVVPVAATQVAGEPPPMPLQKQQPPVSVRVHSPVMGNFYESVNRLQVQVEEKRSLLIEASAVFATRAIWPDVCERELGHLQEVSGPVQELSSCVDRADMGNLSKEENQLRNMLKKPAHDSKGALDALISQVTGLLTLLKNRGSSQAESFEVRKSEYLFTIQSKFTMLKNSLDQIHSFMESCYSL